MNKSILIGRLTTEPEIKEIGENKVVNISIAVNKGNNEADFFPLVIWNITAENLVKYCHKGDMIAVEGRLQNRSYDTENGFKRYVTEVLVNNITYLSGKKEDKEV